MHGWGRSGRVKWASILGIAIAVSALVTLAIVIPSASAANRTLSAPVDITGAAKTCAVGDDPSWSGFDPVNHYVYVPNTESGSITVLSGTCTLVGTIDLGEFSDPFQVAFDPRSDYMDVTLGGSNAVDIIYGLTIEQTVTGFDNPSGIVFDPSCAVSAEFLGCMVVVNSDSDTVESLSGVVANVGNYPIGIDFDPLEDMLYVANDFGDSVTVLDAASLDVDTTVDVCTQPYGVAFDQATSEDYVVCYSGTVDVLGGFNGPGGIAGGITGFDEPEVVVFDQSNLYMYIANFGDNKVYVFDGFTPVKTDTVKTGVEGLVYDAANGKVYASGTTSSEVYVLS